MLELNQLYQTAVAVGHRTDITRIPGLSEGSSPAIEDDVGSMGPRRLTGGVSL